MTATCTAMIAACPLCHAIDAELEFDVEWRAKDDMQIGAVSCPECKGEIEWDALSRDDQEKIGEAAWDSWEFAAANEADYIFHQRRDL